MLDFEGLVSRLEERKDDPKAYFEEFFQRKNLKDYRIDDDSSTNEIKAVRVMFESKKELRERCELSFSHDPFCLEAFFVYYILSEDIFANYRFQAYYNEIGSYGDFSSCQKRHYIRLLRFYVEFLMDLNNFTKGIKVERQVMRLSFPPGEGNVNRLSFMYASTEEADDFYRLYLDYKFDVYDYILLIVTLLKHEDRLKAREVTLDMFQNIEYARYLDHLWDLDEKDEKQKEFYSAIDDLYEYISSIPDFFTFINLVREASEEDAEVL